MKFFNCVIYDIMRYRLGFSVKAMCGGKFYCMLCLEVLIDGVRRFIYSFFSDGLVDVW